MICSLHMFCSIFNRILGLIEEIARQENIIDECNKWFEINHFKITFYEEEKMKIKVL